MAVSVPIQIPAAEDVRSVKEHADRFTRGVTEQRQEVAEGHRTAADRQPAARRPAGNRRR